LEDTRNWVPLSDDRMPTLQGKYKVPHSTGRESRTKSSASSTWRMSGSSWNFGGDPDGLTVRR
jgi:hypothetical protein